MGYIIETRGTSLHITQQSFNLVSFEENIIGTGIEVKSLKTKKSL